MTKARSSGSSEPASRGTDRGVASIRYLVVDCLDLDRSARFWGPILGVRPSRRLDNYLFMGPVLPGCDFVLQQVDAVTRDKTPIHFDIQGSSVEDFGRIVARAEQLGGTIVETVEEEQYTLAVMTDPDGNEFCVNRTLSGPPAGGPAWSAE